MAHPRSGDTVKIRYTGQLDDGRVFASSKDQAPLEVTVGEGTLIPTLEETLTHMEPGEERTVTIPAERAYGPRDPERVLAVDRTEFPEDIEPVPGQQLKVRQDDGHVSVVTIADVTDDQVTIDTNHPLAGENLTFRVELLEVRAAGSM